jgi:hypothetical protein
MFWFVFYGVIAPQKQVWKVPLEEDGFREHYVDHFPEVGVYFVPHFNREEDEVAPLVEEGPLLLVHVLSKEGKPMADAQLMGLGFLTMLGATFLIALLLRMGFDAMPGYSRRVQFVVLFGLAAVVMIQIGDAVWWRIPLEWKLLNGSYDVLSMLIVGLVLAKFVTPVKAGDMPG